MHGIGFQARSKVLRLLEFANKMNAEVVVLNYRGYAYSQDVQPTEEGIMIDA